MGESNKIKNILLFLSTIIFIECTYRQEAYHFFDNFYYKDIFETFEKQQPIKKCSAKDGPECFFLSNYNKDYREPLYNIRPEIRIPDYLSIRTIKDSLLDSTDIIKKKAKSTLNKPYNLNSVTQMALLLNFESFDVKTKNKDMIAPSEIITNFELGYIKLTLYGKLLLTYNNKIQSVKNIESLEDKYNIPSGTYGIIQSEKLIIKFDKPMFFNSLFIKKNKDNRSKQPFEVYGEFKGKTFLIGSENNAEYDKWIKVNTINALTDSIILPKGFDIDNLSIVYSSSYDSQAPKISQGKYSKIIEKAIKQGLSTANVKVINLNDLQNINDIDDLNNFLHNNP